VSAAPAPRAAGGLLAVVAASFLWATLGVAGKTLYAAGAHPLVVVGWRAIIAASALAGILTWRSPALLRIPRSQIAYFVLYGLVVAANYACYFLALHRMPVAVAIILLYTYPAFTALGARAFFREPIDLSKAAAIVLTFAGIVLIAGGDRAQAARVDPAGLLLGLGAGLTMAAYSLLGKRATRSLSPWTTALYSFAFAAVWLTLAQGSAMGAAFRYTPPMWIGLLYLGLGPTLMAYGMFLWAVQRVEVSRASLWSTLEPLLAALLAFVVLGEAIRPVQMLGGGLVLMGVAILQWRKAESR